MERNRRYMQMTAAMWGASMLALTFPARSVGQCCQAPCGSAAAPAAAVADLPTKGPAQRCCPTAKSWRHYFKPSDPSAARILDLADRAIVKVSEFYEKFTFGEHSTKWSSWCSGKPKTGTNTPCTPKCCEKPVTDTTSKSPGDTKGSG